MTLPLVAIVIAATVAAAIFARRWFRCHRHLTQLVTVPWWQWPLARVAIELWKREVWRDVAEAAGFVKNGKRTRGAWRSVFVRCVDGEWWVKVVVRRGFDQGDEDTDTVRNAKKLVVNQVRGTFGLGPVDTDWDFWWYRRHVILTPKQVVPKKALYSDEDTRTKVAVELTPTTMVPAIGKADHAVTHDVKGDACHVLISGTTMGGGKSETLKTFGVQHYSQGAHLLIVDTIRQFSHIGWAVNPTTRQPWPGITYADTTAEAAHWLVAARDVMLERGADTKQRMLRGETVDWTRLVILLDDVNGLMKELKGTEALDALGELLWVGRGVDINIYAAFQRGSAHAAGGGDYREAYGLRIWADGSSKTGDMLADAIDKAKRPTPKPHTVQPGHSVFIYGSLAFEAQRILYTDDEARQVCRQAAPQHRMGLTAVGSGDNHPHGRHDDDNEADHREGLGEAGHVGLVLEPGREHGEHDDGDEGQVERFHRSLPQPSSGQHDRRGPEHREGLIAASETHHHQAHHEDSDEQHDHVTLDSSTGHGDSLHDSVRSATGHKSQHPPLTWGRTGNHQPTDAPISPTHVASPPGLSRPFMSDPCDQGFTSGLAGGERDEARPNYRTLAELATRDWCPWKAGTLERYARDPQRRFPAPQVPYDRGRNTAARWSEVEVQDWVEKASTREHQDGYGPLIYFIVIGGKPTLVYGVVVKIGKTVNLGQRVDSYGAMVDISDVVDTIPCTGNDEESPEEEMDRLEDELHAKYEAEGLRLGRSERFKVEGSLAVALGVSREVTV